ncbi:methyltransferase, TIGR04325 family [Synechocystis sp. PCC 7338]|uniref:methyltransferase, TIGR04325 family n=1 Tax=Synechocystis sp. PCC 7338 TaxID=2732530 RepID=UPI001BAF00B5|nr:methyltransferase, TIGR04325 family [Synechocystis sp. PCC 7338]
MDSQKSSFSSKVKLLAKELMPPLIWKALKKLNSSEQYGFFGDYASWDAALENSDGYDATLILDKVKESMLKVKNGEAVYARDSFILEKKEYSFPILTILLKIIYENSGRLNVLDFGGALGCHYYQYRDFLFNLNLKELKWNVVEQKNFVECGQTFFENEELKFYFDIDTCLKQEKPNVILLSGVIQCLEKPYEFIETLINKHKFSYILIDRLALINGYDDRLTIQKIPPEIYNASYPSWFFSEAKFLDYFQEKYDLIFEFQGDDKVNILSEFKGFIFKKKNEN